MSLNYNGAKDFCTSKALQMPIIADEKENECVRALTSDRIRNCGSANFWNGAFIGLERDTDAP